MTLLWGDTFRTSAANSSACWRFLAKDASNGSCEKSQCVATTNGGRLSALVIHNHFRALNFHVRRQLLRHVARPFHLDFPRLRFTSTSFTSYIKRTSENFGKHIVCQVIHQLVHRLKCFAAVGASCNNNASAAFRNRRRRVYERIQTVFHQLGFCRAPNSFVDCLSRAPIAVLLQA